MTQRQKKLLTEKLIRPMVRKMLKEGNETSKFLTEEKVLYYLKKFNPKLYDEWTTIDFDEYGSEEDIMEKCNQLLDKFKFPYTIIDVWIRFRGDYNDYYFKLKKK